MILGIIALALLLLYSPRLINAARALLSDSGDPLAWHEDRGGPVEML
jgi:hypothetical protein